MRKQYMIGVVGLFLAGSLQAQNNRCLAEY